MQQLSPDDEELIMLIQSEIVRRGLFPEEESSEDSENG